MIRSLVLVCFSALLLASSISVASEDDLEAIRTLLSETSKQLTAATLRGDGEAMLSFYAGDAISLPNYSPMLRGKEAIRLHGEEMERMGFQFKAVDFRTGDLWTCGDLIYEIGNYDIAFCIGDTTEVVKEHGKYLTIWESQPDGSLKIKVETWNADSWPCQ